MKKNQKIVLASRPAAWVEESNFRLEEDDIPQPGINQVLVRNHWLSLDPYMRGRMADAKSYAKPVAIGEVMIGGTAGEVVQSNHPDFAPGDKVVGAMGWQLFGVADGGALQKVDPSVIHLSAWLGPVGMPGVTAWIGLFDICAPKPGDTVVVTAASGAVGSVVGQLAKIHGARAIGIAGGADKCRYVTEELGFAACIDYKAGKLRDDLKAVAPGGIDCLFENVGGEIFDTLLTLMKPFSRIALCGLVSQYNSAPWPMQNISAVLMNRIMMQGFIVTDDMSRWPPALKELVGHVASGRIKYRESIAEGLAAAPAALISLLKGGNFGKQLVKLV
jgi:NADPH-dependent curcumin reductase CurA